MEKKVLLLIRDGWGYREEKFDNAIANTATPETDKLMSTYPNTLLQSSGQAVGLPEGYQGNSEVGHMTIGSGRVIFQSLERINQSIEKEDFFKIPEFLQAIENCKKNKTSLHLIGLLQTQGVHSHINHLLALLDLCKKQNFKDVLIHVITDGRDAPITESIKHLTTLDNKLNDLNFGKIATISGRYYAMDRDNRWDRTELAFNCIVHGNTNETFTDPIQTIKQSHEKDETDEFIKPKKSDDYQGIKENDSIIFYNYRTDRPRQFTKAMVEKDFKEFKSNPPKTFYVGMTQYYRPMNAKVAFKDQEFTNLLGEVIAQNNLNQLRISETEKYAHVTFFFNGQKEEPNKNEERILIQSPKVETYDKKPEMSVHEITKQLIKEIDKDKHNLIVTNFVNGDMVGHTGILPAIEKAVKSVDECIGKTIKAALEKNYTILVFADHGNAEDQTPEYNTSHTINQVPIILISNQPELKDKKLESGSLADIAPTVLKLLDIKKPKEMTGKSLIN
jgi:2,3-bisphosphoglycerate-independent phosphoglycerate mutase